MDAIQEHILYMVKFCFAISVWIVNSIIDDPKLIQFRIHIHTGNNANAFDDSMCISAVLTSHQLNLMRKILVSNRIIEDDKSCWGLNNLILNVLPSQFRAKFFSIQVTVQSVMAELLAMFSKIRQRIIDLANQQVLTILQAADDLGSWSHTPKLICFAPVRQPLSFA